MNQKIAVVGLGYVGLPVAVAFGQKYEVIGFDIDRQRIRDLRLGRDQTKEVAPEVLKGVCIDFTSEAKRLNDAKFIIVAVPTPIDSAKRPNLGPLKTASKIVGQNLSKGATVVYESTVYPGVTEEVCRPILEGESGLRCGIDFKVGYSPERINPGDREHSFAKIVKVVSGMDAETLEEIASVYGEVVEAGIYRAPSIKVAEAAKVIENTQRDLNLALMNELAVLFDKMGLDTREVLAAAGTKWNFLPFEPGLVGGHCIGVDPYYLTYKAEQLGYHPQVILAGRRINDSMGKYIAEQTVKRLIKVGKVVKGANVLMLGFTFKEDIPDVRNTRVADICTELADFGVDVHVYDPLADPDDVRRVYGIDTLSWPGEKAPYDAMVVAVKHRQFGELDLNSIGDWGNGRAVLIDVKGLFDRDAASQKFEYWRV